MNRITKYHNDLNAISTRRWTAEEMDFFFLIITCIRDQGSQRLTFSKSELVKAAGYKGQHDDRLKDRLKHLVKEVGGLSYLHEDKNSFEVWHMFSEFRVDWSEGNNDFTATVQISPKFEYMVNELNANFTKFEFAIFSRIRGGYAKTLFRHLKQFRSTGVREFKLEDFKFLMGVPEKYRACDISARILQPCLKELKKYFPDLAVKAVKSNLKGNPIIGYRFTWKKEKIGTWVDEQPLSKREAIEEKKRFNSTEKGKAPLWYNDTGWDVETFAVLVTDWIHQHFSFNEIREKIDKNLPDPVPGQHKSTKEYALEAVDAIDSLKKQGTRSIEDVIAIWKTDAIKQQNDELEMFKDSFQKLQEEIDSH